MSMQIIEINHRGVTLEIHGEYCPAEVDGFHMERREAEFILESVWHCDENITELFNSEQLDALEDKASEQ